MKKDKYAVPKYAMTEKGLRALLKKKTKKTSSLSEWAKENDITPQSVSAFMRKVQHAGLKIPEVLGYRPQIVFIPLDKDRISHSNPPRRATEKPSRKVDHTREPVEKKGLKTKDDRKETKKRLKKRNKGK